MKRALVLVALLTMAMGSLGYGFGGACCPEPEEPCCYTAFWVGETVYFKLVIPFGFFCCPTDELIVGWRIETLDGALVYEYTFTEPVAPGTEIQWDQRDLAGQQVAASFYNIVITTTKGEYRTAIKIVERTPCCWTILRSKPCGVSFCKPYIKVYRRPSCCLPKPSCCLPSPCRVSFFLGCCNGDD
jgi:hypothetical protein